MWNKLCYKNSYLTFIFLSEATLPFENKSEDKIHILAFKNGENVGIGHVPLHDVQENQYYTLKITKLFKKQEIGELIIKINYLNEDQPFYKDLVKKKLKNYFEKIVNQLLEGQETEIYNGPETEVQYGVLIHEQKQNIARYLNIFRNYVLVFILI